MQWNTIPSIEDSSREKNDVELEGSEGVEASDSLSLWFLKLLLEECRRRERKVSFK